MDNYTRNSIILWVRVLFITLLLSLLLASCDKAKKLIDEARMVINPNPDQYSVLYAGIRENGSYTWAFRASTTLSDARNKALAACNEQLGSGNCEERNYVKNGCIAAVVGTNSSGRVNLVVGGAGNTETEAQGAGIRICIEGGSMNCRVDSNSVGGPATICNNN